VIDYLGVGGVFGSERRRLGPTSERLALEHARMMIRDHAGRVEVFSREVPLAWTSVKQLRRPATPGDPITDSQVR
jgi:hypothetical protein